MNSKPVNAARQFQVQRAATLTYYRHSFRL